MSYRHYKDEARQALDAAYKLRRRAGRVVGLLLRDRGRARRERDQARAEVERLRAEVDSYRDALERHSGKVWWEALEEEPRG